MEYKLEQKKFRELAKGKFYHKGETIKYVTRDGADAEYANGYPVPKNDYKTRIKPDRPPIVGTNHERMLARKKARETAP